MKYPRLNEIPVSRSLTDAFGGYNHNLRIGDGEFYDMKNLTSSDYPILSPRPRRGTYEIKTEALGNSVDKPIPLGMIAKDAFCYCAGGNFYIDRGDGGVDCIPMDLDKSTFKTLISMGAYVIIMPDKKYINTEIYTEAVSEADGKIKITRTYNEYGNIEAEDILSSGTAKFSLCKLDGESYEKYEINNEAPTEPVNMQLWLDTSSAPNVLKQYSASQGEWVSIVTTYIKIAADGIGKDFSEGDGVFISGIEDGGPTELNGNTSVIWARNDNFIVVTGIISEVKEQDLTKAPITVSRKMPEMDFIIESQNRLWGCRYGKDNNGNTVNEIYASKLGDFKNWNVFSGISTDSYAASLGSDGAFTGAITHLGYPLFFKEGCMHKVYGNMPSSYQIQTTACRGVQKGCEKSLAIVNETLYYKARSAVCAYDGSLPVEMSSVLGDESYSEAVAGALGNKYYVSMKDTKGVYHLFVYDSLRGMWHREDNTKALQFCSYHGELYYIDEVKKIEKGENGEDAERKYYIIKTALGSGTADTEQIEWMCETGIIGVTEPDKKYISRVDVRLSLEVGARVFFHVQYDSSEKWEHIYTMTGTTLRSFSIPIRPKRCDHFRMRIEGWGEAKIFSICKVIEQGSDV